MCLFSGFVSFCPLISTELFKAPSESALSTSTVIRVLTSCPDLTIHSRWEVFYSPVMSISLMHFLTHHSPSLWKGLTFLKADKTSLVLFAWTVPLDAHFSPMQGHCTRLWYTLLHLCRVIPQDSRCTHFSTCAGSFHRTKTCKWVIWMFDSISFYIAWSPKWNSVFIILHYKVVFTLFGGSVSLTTR